MPRRTHSLHPLSSSLTGRGGHVKRGVYGSDGWSRVDRVQELGDDTGNASIGHTGCVNALSWSDDGTMLLSGSDDKRVCIWTPDNEPTDSGSQRSPHPLKLSHRIITGHRANIFCAKFLPHTNTPTIVTCAGDGDIRVFDLENLASADIAGFSSNQLLGISGPGVQVLRCHEDRAKRIATQDAPNLFLSVSEDGTVRQHDLRKPHECRTECPPPLFRAPPGVDLYSLSMSPLRPYIFAVAGQTDCAYICDRRMLPRQTPSWGPHTHRASEVYCVRRLGIPDSEWEKSGSIARTYRDRHITSVKISADDPDEVICAFAMHSTSLFSLREDPAESSARVGNSSVLPPNSDSNTAKGARKSASPKLSKHPKRRLSSHSEEQAASRARTDTEDGDGDERPRWEQFLRSRSATPDREIQQQRPPSRPLASTHPDFARLESMVDDMSDEDREELEELAADAVDLLSTRVSSRAGTGGASPRDPIPEWNVDSDAEEITLAEYRRASAGHNAGEDESDSDEGNSDLDDLRRAREEGNVDDWATRYLRARGLTAPENDEEEVDEDDDHDMEVDEDDDMLDDFEDDDDFGDIDEEDSNPFFYHTGALSKDSQFRNVDMLYPKRMFKGARNMETVKDCNFLGDASDKVSSGSDDGTFFVWDKLTGKLEGIWQGDDAVVNVMEQHPTLPLVAVSGIDSTVKIFAPTSDPPRPSFVRTGRIDPDAYLRPFRSAVFEPSAIQILARLMARPDGSLPTAMMTAVQAMQRESANEAPTTNPTSQTAGPPEEPGEADDASYEDLRQACRTQ